MRLQWSYRNIHSLEDNAVTQQRCFETPPRILVFDDFKININKFKHPTPNKFMQSASWLRCSIDTYKHTMR